ncbi:hypothetical protein GM240_15995 [Peribacillus butanolivorans]|uniref:Uncharacterized protein n=2 Tax=Peribacillus butanolivorans TaxID=421767 RepID=A0ABN5N8Y4_9BACI|nr:hypothetical protein DTO10_22480 [Peribacillus butanolivorans]QNU05271.1 hypothetical protein GM240_15995 [Peribacillus butanolivorans]
MEVIKMFKSIIIFIVSLFILYLVIENAVKNGINRSKIGQLLESKYGFEETKKSSFLDDDLDKE